MPNGNMQYVFGGRPTRTLEHLALLILPRPRVVSWKGGRGKRRDGRRESRKTGERKLFISGSRPRTKAMLRLSSARIRAASRQFRSIATLTQHKDSFGGSTRGRDGSSEAVAALMLAGTASTIAASFSSTASGGRDAAICEQPPSVTLRSYKTLPNVPVGGAYPFSPTHGVEIPGPAGIPSRAQQVSKLMKSSRDNPYDVLVIGGGATGGCEMSVNS